MLIMHNIMLSLMQQIINIKLKLIMRIIMLIILKKHNHFPNFWATFVIKFAVQNFEKSPNLVTLVVVVLKSYSHRKNVVLAARQLADVRQIYIVKTCKLRARIWKATMLYCLNVCFYPAFDIVTFLFFYFDNKLAWTRSSAFTQPGQITFSLAHSWLHSNPGPLV